MIKTSRERKARALFLKYMIIISLHAIIIPLSDPLISLE